MSGGRAATGDFTTSRLGQVAVHMRAEGEARGHDGMVRDADADETIARLERLTTRSTDASRMVAVTPGDMLLLLELARVGLAHLRDSTEQTG